MPPPMALNFTGVPLTSHRAGVLSMPPPSSGESGSIRIEKCGRSPVVLISKEAYELLDGRFNGQLERDGQNLSLAGLGYL
jgi:hypothetical protein